MGNVAAPSQGLGDAHNYFLYSNCAPITDLSVIVYVAQDIVANIGLTIQLNAIGPATAPGSWLQYVFAIGGTGAATTIDCRTDYWPTAGGGDHVSSTVSLMTLPNQGAAFPTLPAGYQLTIALTNDSSGNILAATFLVVDTKTGQAKTSGPIQPLGPPTPISAFELNIVGPASGRQSLLSSGAGTITCVATSQLTVLQSLSGLPKNCISADWVTGESANTTYGGLPAGPYSPGNPVNQTFTTAAEPFYKPGAAFAVSQQIGLNQTNLYAVDQSGRIAVFSVKGSGRWGIALPLGPTGFARTGASLAASQQFGANQQTNLFVVDQNGNLQTFWTEAGGPWNGPVPIGSGASSGQPLAVSQQFGAPDQTDLFLVDKNGTLNVYWVQSAGKWNGPVLVGPAGHAPKQAPLAVSQQFGAPHQTDVFVVDTTGALTVFWIQATGPWSAPVSISKSGIFPAGAHIAVSQQFGAPDQTDVFAVDNDGQLTAYWVQGSGSWGGPVPIGPKGLAAAGAPVAASQHFGQPNQTDVYVVDKSGTINVFSVQAVGPWSSGAKIGPAGLAPTDTERSGGSFVLACQQFGVPDQTDVFVINQTGVGGPGWPTVLWEDGGGWSGPGALQTQV